MALQKRARRGGFTILGHWVGAEGPQESAEQWGQTLGPSTRPPPGRGLHGVSTETLKELRQALLVLSIHVKGGP